MKIIVMGVAILLIACSPGTTRQFLGSECERNSQCDAPLVCRIGYCRNECRTTVDCPAPLACVRDQQGLGACQLLAERSCALQTDCNAPLVCRLRQCTEACVESRDCLPGAQCVELEGARVCIDVSTIGCTSDSECRVADPGTFCLDGRCRDQCHTDRDCRNGLRCYLPGVCASSAPVDAAMSGLADGATPRDGAPLRIDANMPRPDGAVAATCGAPMTGVVAMSLGRVGGCAIVERDGEREVRCWGSVLLSDGELMTTRGCASFMPGIEFERPVEVGVGGGFVCTRLESGQVHCAGAGFGLGRGGIAEPPGDTLFGPVANLSDAAQLFSATASHACAIRTNREVVCWGLNNNNHIGIVTPVGVVTRPTPMMRAAPFGTMDLGGDFTCGIDAAGTIDCWGRPGDWIPASQGFTATALGIGETHGCALSDAGTVHCWGSNTRGELGDGTTTPRTAMQPVIGLPGPASAVSGGVNATCALVGRDGYCWGDSFVSDPANTRRPLTSPVRVFEDIDSVQVAFEMACARRADRILCVGRGGNNRLGSAISMSATPIEVRSQ